MHPSIKLEDLKWSSCCDHLPDSRLTTVIELAGVPMHLEAWEIKRSNDGFQDMADGDSDSLDHLAAAVGSTGSFQTMTLNDKEYVLLATPFCT